MINYSISRHCVFLINSTKMSSRKTKISKIADNQYNFQFRTLPNNNEYYDMICKNMSRDYYSDVIVINSASGRTNWRLVAEEKYIDKWYETDEIWIYIKLLSTSDKDDTLFQVTISRENQICTKKITTDIIFTRICFIHYENKCKAAADHNIMVDIKPISSCLSLRKDFANIFASKEFSDVTLVAQDGTEVKAHKAILCARSQVFAAMFRNNFEESKTNRIQIDDMDAEVIEEMLKFLYTSGDISERWVEELFIAANKYSLLDLQTMCESSLINTMEIATVADILLLADRHTNGRLKTEAVEFIANNIETVTETEGWKKLCQTDNDLSSLVLENTKRTVKRMRYYSSDSNSSTESEPAAI
ncbi:TD and POZ domain-containing protein 4-like [Musca autumnalis]|uniref:TD and POZ domain-containing protein 4-like n=1 Tax=Musca autumnalis TaxID=221902 RepID=UPI003CF919E7